jgi:hypothetical protein
LSKKRLHNHKKEKNLMNVFYDRQTKWRFLYILAMRNFPAELCHEVVLTDKKYERILSFKQPRVGEE